MARVGKNPYSNTLNEPTLGQNPANVPVGQKTAAGTPGTYVPPGYITIDSSVQSSGLPGNYSVPAANSAYGTAGAPAPAVKPAAPAPNWYDNLQRPGPTEAATWFDQHKALWDQPGAASLYFTSMKDSLSHPGQGEQALTNLLPTFLQPTAGETNIQNLLPQLGNKTAAETMFDTLMASGAFTTPGAAEDYYRAHIGDFSKTGAAEDFYTKYGERLTQPGELEKHQGVLEGQINSARGAEDFFKQYLLPGVTKKGYLENAADKYNPNSLSYSEQFLLGGGATGGLDQVYNRLYDVGSRKLDEASAARGGFNSGAALRSTEELNKDLTAQHVQALQEASKEADIQKIARTAEGRLLLQGADASTIARLGLGETGAAASDKSVLDRSKGLSDLYTGVSGERRENLTAAGGLAKNAQDALIARLTAGSGVALNSDQARNLRQALGVSASSASTKALLDRLTTSGTLNKDISDIALTRLGKYGDTATNLGTLANDRYRTAGSLASAAGGEDLQRLVGGQNAINSVTSGRQTEDQNFFNNILGLAGKQAGTYGAGTDAARTEQTALAQSEIQGMIQGGQIDAANAQNATALVLELVKAGISAHDAALQAAKYYGKGSTGGTTTSAPSSSGTTTGQDPGYGGL